MTGEFGDNCNMYQQKKRNFNEVLDVWFSDS